MVVGAETVDVMCHVLTAATVGVSAGQRLHSPSSPPSTAYLVYFSPDPSHFDPDFKQLSWDPESWVLVFFPVSFLSFIHQSLYNLS